MYRDFFKCNPTNTGHYKYPIFETLSYDEGCHREKVKYFLNKKDDPEKYVLFYTRHSDLTGKSKNKVVGYFKVGEKTFLKGKVGFISSDTVLLSKEDCYDIDFQSEGVPVSWGKSTIKPTIDKFLKKLMTHKKLDISNEYKVKTIEIMNQLKTKSGRTEFVSVCEKCSVKSQCYWGKYREETKINRLNNLYGKTEECSGKTKKC
jgi:hypothetical protein